MRKELSRSLIAVLLVTAGIVTLAQAQTDRYNALANSAKVENRPTPDAAKALKNEPLYQRGTQIYLWALPLLNTLGMKLVLRHRQKIHGPANARAERGRSAFEKVVDRAASFV